MVSATQPMRGMERASLIGALLVAITSLIFYIAVLASYDEPDTFSNPFVVAYITVIVTGVFGIGALLLGANRSLAIAITGSFGLAGLLGLASFGILLVIVALLLVPSIRANSAGQRTLVQGADR